MTDATMDLLLTFPRIKDLRLHNIYFTKYTIRSLSPVQIHNLYVHECMLSASEAIDFVKAIQNSKKTLKRFDLYCTHAWGWLKTISYFHNNIGNFFKLTHYNLPLALSDTKLQIINKLQNSKSLKYLHIYNLIDEWDEEIDYLDGIHLKDIHVSIQEIMTPW